VHLKASLDLGATQSAFLNQTMVAEDQQLAVSPCFYAPSGKGDEIGQAIFRKLETGCNRF